MSNLPNYIRLCGNCYEVRRENNVRQVRVGDSWIPAIDFPNWLLRMNRYEEWDQLVIYGATKEQP